jgi:hypothetical protein
MQLNRVLICFASCLTLMSEIAVAAEDAPSVVAAVEVNDRIFSANATVTQAGPDRWTVRAQVRNRGNNLLATVDLELERHNTQATPGFSLVGDITKNMNGAMTVHVLVDNVTGFTRFRGQRATAWTRLVAVPTLRGNQRASSSIARFTTLNNKNAGRALARDVATGTTVRKSTRKAADNRARNVAPNSRPGQPKWERGSLTAVEFNRFCLRNSKWTLREWDGGPGRDSDLDEMTAPMISACASDLNMDGRVDSNDLASFLDLFAVGNQEADLNLDGTVDIMDVLSFLDDLEDECQNVFGPFSSAGSSSLRLETPRQRT